MHLKQIFSLDKYQSSVYYNCNILLYVSLSLIHCIRKSLIFFMLSNNLENLEIINSEFL